MRSSPHYTRDGTRLHQVFNPLNARQFYEHYGFTPTPRPDRPVRKVSDIEADKVSDIEVRKVSDIEADIKTA